ncbi:MAG TPA: hypothetical protein VFQ51_03440, partial [Vicinamibacteria bacterium]|nr:hypothetical protein [Vicinamibacteria bacterium]
TRFGAEIDSIVPRNSVSDDGLGVGEGEGVAAGDGVAAGEGLGDGVADGSGRAALPELAWADCVVTDDSVEGPVTEPLDPHATDRPTATTARIAIDVRFHVFIVPSSLWTVSFSAQRPSSAARPSLTGAA